MSGTLVDTSVLLDLFTDDTGTAVEAEQAMEKARKAVKSIVFLIQRGTTTTFVAVRPPG